jgi:hypothetical protein
MKWMISGLQMAACLCTTPAYCGSYYYSGNDLWTLCQTNKNTIAHYYVQGVQDGVERYRELVDMYPSICSPKSSNSIQATDIVCKYLRENPEKRHYSAPDAVINALANAWPCGKKGDKQ